MLGMSWLIVFGIYIVVMMFVESTAVRIGVASVLILGTFVHAWLKKADR